MDFKKKEESHGKEAGVKRNRGERDCQSNKERDFVLPLSFDQGFLEI